jgi:hypothetical protein
MRHRPRRRLTRLTSLRVTQRATRTSIRAAAGKKSIVDNYTHGSHYMVMLITKCSVWMGLQYFVGTAGNPVSTLGGCASIALDALNLPSQRPWLLRGPRRSASRVRNDRRHRRSRSALLPMVGFNTCSGLRACS